MLTVSLLERVCTPCTVCCEKLPIAAGIVSPEAKPAGVPCRSMLNGGCEIYSDRPGVCRKFKCAWLSDATWPDSWRPDISGAFCLREKIEGRFEVSAVYELQDGAFKTPEVRAMVANLASICEATVLIDLAGRRQLIHESKSQSERESILAIRQNETNAAHSTRHAA